MDKEEKNKNRQKTMDKSGKSVKKSENVKGQTTLDAKMTKKVTFVDGGNGGIKSDGLAEIFKMKGKIQEEIKKLRKKSRDE